MEKGYDSGVQSTTSSDFVRKLYKMLEDPSYSEIVRWAEGGETFVVLENEKFTKHILPKHFKHSNFASFVRQLNKYDFHKVRQNSEENTPSSYGNSAWEFKHPEFQENKKDLLDNIKRKAPAPKKSIPNTEEIFPSQQVHILNGQLAASQQQVHLLTERYNELAQGHALLIQQTLKLQRIVKNHEGVMQRVMGFLLSIDEQKRSNRLMFGSKMKNSGNLSKENDLRKDHISSPLQQATELLGQFSAEILPNKELEQMSHNYHQSNEYCTPPTDQITAPVVIHQENHNIDYQRAATNLDNLVYPVGQQNGIDSIPNNQIRNMSYASPPNILLQPPMPDLIPVNSPDSKQKENIGKSLWGERKPSILLVEDDKICARIGSKFLRSFDCDVDIAYNGMEAVAKIDKNPSAYDLILMDIIMPHLDGVTATVYIKNKRPSIPIIAMTSNIRLDNIETYFYHGMNDILPKPFTKEGMLRALEKHLPELKVQITPTAADQISHAVDFTAPSSSSHVSPGLNIGNNMGNNMVTNMGTNIGTELGTNMGPNMGTELGANLGTNMGPNMGTELGANLGTNIGPNMGTELGANLGTNMGPEIRTNLGTNLGTNIGTEMGTNLGPNMGSNMTSMTTSQIKDEILSNKTSAPVDSWNMPNSLSIVQPVLNTPQNYISQQILGNSTFQISPHLQALPDYRQPQLQHNMTTQGQRIAQRRGLPDMPIISSDGHSGKRQRIFGPQSSSFG